MREASRLSLVSSLFALMTQKLQILWYHGGWDWKNFQAAEFARSFFPYAPRSLAAFLCS
jgi:hypothetical protein